MSNYIHMSKEAYEKLKTDLHELKSVKRPEIAKKISVARDFGDLKENAEYHAAKEAMALLETRISQMEETLRRAKIVNPKDITGEHVSIYTSVLILDVNRKTEMEYTLVSQEESNFKEKKISITSPVGKALLGKKVGDIVEVRVPAGTLKYEIREIHSSI